MNLLIDLRPYLGVMLATLFLWTTGACSALDNEVPQESALKDRGYASTARLVTTSWVEEKIDTDNIKIIDVRKPQDYQSGHIPGALNYSYEDLQVETAGVKGMLPPVDNIEAKLSSLGVAPEDTIIIYDHIKNLWSTRLLWTLAVYGHKDARIMDGAWGVWSNEGKNISTASPNVKTSTYKFTAEKNESLIIDLESVRDSLDDNTSVVLDTRSAEEYVGRDVRANRGGHIPDSINVEWVQNVDASGKFLTGDELKKLYSAASVGRDLEIYTLCQTAVRATHSWFVLSELLGYDNVSVYDGSWIEWGNKEDTPIDS